MALSVIVLDASAVVTGLLNDSLARRLMMDELVAVPHLVDSEITNAFRGQVARGALAAPTARQALERWARLGVERFAARSLLLRIWELRGDLSAYDSTYVALAERLECPLVTIDARLSRAPGPRCPITVLPS